jgi:hypothetical protein
MNMTDTYIVNTQDNTYSNQIVESITQPAECGLDWDVVKTPMVALLEGKYPLPIETHVSINRTDNNRSIGIVGAKYEPIQNSKIWDALHTSLDGVDHKVVGGGYTHNGGRIFIQTEVKDSDFKVNGDNFSNYILQLSRWQLCFRDVRHLHSYHLQEHDANRTASRRQGVQA